MIEVLTGPNQFAVRQALDKIVDDFKVKYGNFGLEKVEAGDVEFGRLLEIVAAQPFLAERRMIVLSDISANKSAAENIDKLLDAVSDSTDLIIHEIKFDKRLNLYKTLKKRAEFREFAELDENGLVRWLVNEANERGGKLSQAEATYLVQRAGTNQLGLSHELDKLLTYNSEISRGNIGLLTEPLPQSSTFDLLDAAFAGNHKKVAELYEDQRKQQVEPQAIMGMIAWQVHVIAVVKFNEKSGAQEIAKKAKLNPYVVRKTLNLTRNLTQKEVKVLVGRALALDIRLKSETIDADDAVQHFLLTI